MAKEIRTWSAKHPGTSNHSPNSIRNSSRKPDILPLPISKRNPRLAKILLRHHLHVRPIVNAVIPSSRTNVRAVDFWSILDHQLVHFTAKQRVATQLKRLPETRLIEQEVEALVRTLILLIFAVAIFLVCLADCLRYDLADMLCNLFLGRRV